MKPIFWIIACMLFFMLGFLVDGMITRVPREALAQNDLIRVERCIRKYYSDTRRLPVSLNDAANGKEVPLVNSYGHPIEYSVSNEFEVSLRALGYGGNNSDVKNYYVRMFDVRYAGGDRPHQGAR